MPPTTAAVVNGEEIPRKLIDAFLKNDRESLGLDPSTDAGRQALADLPARILDELVDRWLIGKGARERKVAPDDPAIEAAEKEMITFCGNERRYDAYVAQNGFTRTEYRDAVLRPKLNGKAMIDALTKDLDVPAAEVRTYYDLHAADADFQWPERITGAHILVNAQPTVLAATLEKKEGIQSGTPEMDAAVAKETERRQRLAETVREKALLPSADFATLAKEYSDDVGSRDQGGSLSTFAHGVHPAALDDAFFKLQPGEVGPVVRTDFGFHVIRVNARLPAGPRTFEESVPEIRRRLLREKAAQVMRDWLNHTRTSAKIVVRDLHDLPSAP